MSDEDDVDDVEGDEDEDEDEGDEAEVVASHVAFEIERAWCDDVEATLAEVAASGEGGRLVVVLARWWERREARLDAVTAALEPEIRDELVEAFAGDELFAELARTAPATVRLDALEHLLGRAPRLQALVEIGAPESILAHEREVCAQLLGELDPKARRAHTPMPEVGTTPDAGGEEVLDLTAWLDAMLRAGHADRTDVGIGELFGERPEAQAFLGREPQADPAVRVWPGLSTLAVSPDLAFWASPAIALPRRVEVPGTPPAIVAAEASGPITYAFAGDEPPAELLPPLAKRLRALAKDRALISFVWLATDTAGPWRPIG